jgi:ABC-2 type transport system permease protein
MNTYGIQAIYRFEMGRWFRTLGQSLFSPVLSTSLYFIVFGSAIGSRMVEIGGVSYGAFIVPGLIMLSILTESVSNASFGIYMPRWAGTIYELLSAPVSAMEAVCGYVGAAATKSIVIGLVILATARLFVPYEVQNWPLVILFLVLTSVSFCLFGFILGVLADGFEKLQIVPMLILTPLTFLGGTFYSIDMLPEPWRTLTLFNPVVYLISGFRYAFFGEQAADVNIGVSLAAISVFLAVCLGAVWWIFKTGYRLKV